MWLQKEHDPNYYFSAHGTNELLLGNRAELIADTWLPFSADIPVPIQHGRGSYAHEEEDTFSYMRDVRYMLGVPHEAAATHT